MYGLNAQKISEYPKGYLIETSDGYYYVPKNCTDNTSTIVYAHGAGNSNKEYWDSSLKEGIDAIYVVPKHGLSHSNMDETYARIQRDLSKIQGAVGITNNNMTTIAHSSGGEASVYFMVKNIKNNPDIGPQTCVLIDP